MFKINLKLKFQITKTTELKPEVLYERILSQLQKEEYRIIEKDNTKIVFDDHIYQSYEIRGFSSNLYEGFFEFAQSENVAVFKLSYFINYQIPTLFFIFTILYSIFNSPGGLFFSLFIVVTTLIDTAIQKRRAKYLIEEVIIDT